MSNKIWVMGRYKVESNKVIKLSELKVCKVESYQVIKLTPPSCNLGL